MLDRNKPFEMNGTENDIVQDYCHVFSRHIFSVGM